MDGVSGPRGATASLGSVSSLASITSLDGHSPIHDADGESGGDTSARHDSGAGGAVAGRDAGRGGSAHGKGWQRRARDRTSSGTVAPSLDADQALNRVGFGAFHVRLTLVAACFWVRSVTWLASWSLVWVHSCH